MSKIRSRTRLLVGVSVVLGAAAIATGVYAASGDGGAGLAATSVTGQASVAVSNCKVPKFDFITNDVTSLSTTSTSYVAVPGMSTTVTLAGTTPSCVVVDVSGFAFAPSGALEYVSVQLDGALGNPVEVQFAGDTKGVYAEEHAALFAFPGVAPGSHTVTMVFRSFNGSTVYLHRPAMQIAHK